MLTLDCDTANSTGLCVTEPELGIPHLLLTDDDDGRPSVPVLGFSGSFLLSLPISLTRILTQSQLYI